MKFQCLHLWGLCFGDERPERLGSGAMLSVLQPNQIEPGRDMQSVISNADQPPLLHPRCSNMQRQQTYMRAC